MCRDFVERITPLDEYSGKKVEGFYLLTNDDENDSNLLIRFSDGTTVTIVATDLYNMEIFDNENKIRAVLQDSRQFLPIWNFDKKEREDVALPSKPVELRDIETLAISKD